MTNEVLADAIEATFNLINRTAPAHDLALEEAADIVKTNWHMFATKAAAESLADAIRALISNPARVQEILANDARYRYARMGLFGCPNITIITSGPRMTPYARLLVDKQADSAIDDMNQEKT